MDKTEAIAAARSKLDEARYHLGKLREVEGSQYLEESKQRYDNHFPAFLAAARSALQVLASAEKEVTGTEQTFWQWQDSIVNGWPAEESELYKALKSARNDAIHKGASGVGSTIEYVPHSELPRVPRHPFDGRVIKRRLPGIPEPKSGVRRFTVRIGDEDKAALESCVKYLELVRRLVDGYAEK